MAKLNQLYKFNTGRYYGDNQQPIDWMIIEGEKYQYEVLFADRARGICGIIPCFVSNIEDLVNDRWVLGQYDAYQYIDNISVLGRLK